MKSSFLMLAQKFREHKHLNQRWFLSEKLDGMRVFWDGGLTWGIPKHDVPWANMDKTKGPTQYATGLWSRYGGIVHAPDVWLKKLPNFPLDGELWSGYNDRQWLMSTVRSYGKDIINWSGVSFHVFDAPDLDTVLEARVVNEINYRHSFKVELDWVNKLQSIGYPGLVRRNIDFGKHLRFEDTVAMLVEEKLQLPCILIPQYDVELNTDTIDFHMQKVLERNGEGLMLRDPESYWVPERSHSLLKIKKYSTSTATVIGATSGRKTEKGSKLLGMMGALIVEYADVTFELSGFTEEERTLPDTEWAALNPGRTLPKHIQPVRFPIGTIIEFKYRGINRDGIPNEASFLR